MSKRARSWNGWLTSAVLLSVAAGVAFLFVRSSEKPSGRDELKIEVAGLRSEAAVGQLLSEQAAAGDVTSVFLEAQASQLRKNVEAARGRLKPSDFEPGLRDTVGSAGVLAAKLSDAAGALASSSANVQRAGGLKAEFAGLSSQLMSMEDGLKQ